LLTLKTLGILAWILWAVDLAGVTSALLSTSHDRGGGYIKGVATLVFYALLAVLVMMGGLLFWFTRVQSQGGIWTMVCILGWPPVVMAGSYLSTMMKVKTTQVQEARIGAFNTPLLRQLSSAISAKDSAAVGRLLARQPDLKVKDRAGNDLLTYACSLVRQNQGDVEPVRLLLDAGMNPNESRTVEGEDLVNFMIVDSDPKSQEVVRLLVEHGAKPDLLYQSMTPLKNGYHEIATIEALLKHGANKDQLDEYGLPMVVDYVVARAWDAALYMVEHGARLDGQTSRGVSLDYYLDEWAKGTYEKPPPEGFYKLQAAVQARRAAKK